MKFCPFPRPDDANVASLLYLPLDGHPFTDSRRVMSRLKTDCTCTCRVNRTFGYHRRETSKWSSFPRRRETFKKTSPRLMGELFAFAAYAAGPSLKIRLLGFRLSFFLFSPIFPCADAPWDPFLHPRRDFRPSTARDACVSRETRTAQDDCWKRDLRVYCRYVRARAYGVLSGDESPRPPSQARDPFPKSPFKNPFSPWG